MSPPEEFQEVAEPHTAASVTQLQINSRE